MKGSGFETAICTAVRRRSEKYGEQSGYNRKDQRQGYPLVKFIQPYVLQRVSPVNHALHRKLESAPCSFLIRDLSIAALISLGSLSIW